MSDVKLTIDKIEVTPSGDVNTALTYELDNLTTGATAGSRSERGLSIIADKKTLSLFPQISDTTQVIGAIPGRKPATMEAGGVTVFRGEAVPLESTGIGGPYGRKDGAVKVALIGNNATWFSALSKLPIADVIREYVTAETFTDAFCQDNDNADPATQKFGLFLARTVEWAEPTEIKRIELTLFAFWGAIFRDAFALAGYHLDSDFLDGEGARYILPLPPRPVGADYGADFAIYMADADNSTVLPGFGPLPVLVILTGDAGNQNPGAHYDNSTGFYTVPFSGHYFVKVGGDAFNFYGPFTSTGAQVFDAQPVFPGSAHHSERVFLEAGTEIGLFASSLTSGNQANASYLQITPDLIFGENYTVALDMFTPSDWYVGEALQGFAQLFNLAFDTDNDLGRVCMKPRDRYAAINNDGTTTSTGGYYSDTAALDWGGKIDLSKQSNPKLSSGKNKQRFKYDTDGADATAEALDKNANFRFSEARYLFPGNRYEEGENVEAVKFFKKTLMYRADEIKHASSPITPVLPLLQGAVYPASDSSATALEPRILYFAGRRAGLDGYVNLRLTPGLSLYDFPAAWFVPYNRGNEEAAPSLSFANELSNFGQPIPGLLQRFHLQKMKRQEIGLLVEEWARLKPTDIANLNFRNRVHVAGSTYILRRVEGYRPDTNASTKVILEADAAPTTADATKIESSPILGLK